MKRFFLENLPIKLLSLFLALILFVLVREDRVKEFELDIPVVTERTPEDFVFVGELPQEIRVRVRGKWSKILEALERKNQPYTVDMRGLKDGDVVFFDENRVERIIGPHGPTIVTVTPRSATIRLEAKVLKRVGVRPDLIGEPARGYLLKRDAIRIEPAEVAVRGPAESVRDVEEVLTAPISIDGLDRDLIRDDVALRQPSRPYLTIGPQRVRVEIPVEEVQTSTLVAGVAIEVRDCPPLHICQVAPRRVPVQLLGPMLALEHLRAAEGAGLLSVSAASEGEGLAPGRYDLPIRIQSPPGVVVTLSTPTVTLDVISTQPVTPPVVRDLVPADVREGDAGGPDSGTGDEPDGAATESGDRVQGG